MGCVLGVCAAQAACCCGSAACHLCCACCPSSVASIMTRLMYLFFIILGILTSSLFLIDDVAEALKKSHNIPFIKEFVSSDPICDQITGFNCASVIGYGSVYRVWFGFAMFFLFMAIVTIGVQSSKDCRASFQNGFWFLKFLIILGTVVGAFFIPAEPFNKVWLYLGMVGGILFIFVQVVFLIEFAHSWTESWQDRADESPCYKVAFLISALILYGLSLAGIVAMYIYFTKSEGCILNKVLISVNLIFCVIVSIISILPGVQEANPRSGLLQASLVTLYVSYLTFSALSSEPIDHSSSYQCTKNLSNIPGGGNSMLVVGIIIAVLTIFVVSLKSSGDGGSSVSNDEEAPVQRVEDDEEDSTQYSYWLFHVLCLLGSLYLMMVMTNWLEPQTVTGGFKFSPSWASVWVQIVASWLCLVLYVWTIIAPIACPNRTFGWANSDD